MARTGGAVREELPEEQLAGAIAKATQAQTQAGATNQHDHTDADATRRRERADALANSEYEKWLAQITAGERIKQADTDFERTLAEISGQFMAENPFAELVGSFRSDRSKYVFVTPELAQTVFDACPWNEWRLIFALSRFGGLRCPSEHLALRWPI